LQTRINELTTTLDSWQQSKQQQQDKDKEKNKAKTTTTTTAAHPPALLKSKKSEVNLNRAQSTRSSRPSGRKSAVVSTISTAHPPKRESSRQSVLDQKNKKQVQRTNDKSTPTK